MTEKEKSILYNGDYKGGTQNGLYYGNRRFAEKPTKIILL